MGLSDSDLEKFGKSIDDKILPKGKGSSDKDEIKIVVPVQQSGQQNLESYVSQDNSIFNHDYELKNMTYSIYSDRDVDYIYIKQFKDNNSFNEYLIGKNSKEKKGFILLVEHDFILIYNKPEKICSKVETQYEDNVYSFLESRFNDISEKIKKCNNPTVKEFEGYRTYDLKCPETFDIFGVRDELDIFQEEQKLKEEKEKQKKSEKYNKN